MNSSARITAKRTRAVAKNVLMTALLLCGPSVDRAHWIAFYNEQDAHETMADYACIEQRMQAIPLLVTQISVWLTGAPFRWPFFAMKQLPHFKQHLMIFANRHRKQPTSFFFFYRKVPQTFDAHQKTALAFAAQQLLTPQFTGIFFEKMYGVGSDIADNEYVLTDSVAAIVTGMDACVN